jgi:hypothetical protein
MDFLSVEGNLRDSFRALAAGRKTGQVLELRGVSIASLGVAFQMFNAAFLSSYIESQKDLEGRLSDTRRFFRERGMPWSFWVCESWMDAPLRRRLAQTFDSIGLRIASEMPGMIVNELLPPNRVLPPIEVCPVTDARTLDHFRAIGSACFRVPPDWFAEVFNQPRSAFPCWVGYAGGLPVATAAIVATNGVAGLYNVATMPDFRERGYGEAITRFALHNALAEHPGSRLILQATGLGLSLYERMGFRTVTRFTVFNSR